MQLGALALGIGVLAGAVVNILAEILPHFGLQDENTGDETSEIVQTDAAQVGGSTKRWNLERYIVITIILIPLIGFALSQPPPHAIPIAFYMIVLTLISVIDIEHRLVLSIVLLPSFLIAFVEILITHRIHVVDALVGYAVAQIIVMLYYLMGGLYLRIVNARRKDPVTEIAFGFGDVSLATFCGLIVGYPHVVYMLILMALIGGVMAFGYLVVRLVIVRRYEAHMAFPYGPAITIAAAAMLLWGDQIVYYLLGGR